MSQITEHLNWRIVSVMALPPGMSVTFKYGRYWLIAGPAPKLGDDGRVSNWRSRAMFACDEFGLDLVEVAQVLLGEDDES